MEITRLAQEIAKTSTEKGFWEGDNLLYLLPTKLALVHDEVSEALKVHREDYGKGDIEEWDGLAQMSKTQSLEFSQELADIIIRVLDIAGYYDLPIEEAVLKKVRKNRERPQKHGKRY